MCLFIWIHFHIFFRNPSDHTLSTRRLLIKQRSSLVNPIIVTKSQLILFASKQNLFASVNEKRRHLMQMVSKPKLQIRRIMHLTRQGNKIPDGCHFWPTPCELYVREAIKKFCNSVYLTEKLFKFYFYWTLGNIFLQFLVSYLSFTEKKHVCIYSPLCCCVFTFSSHGYYSVCQFVRPPGTVVQGGLMFCCGF